MKSFNREWTTLVTEIETMVQQRMDNTGETHDVAMEVVLDYLRKRFNLKS